MDTFDSIELQMKRIEAYQDGVYDLDSWEGFKCSSCGNRQLTASGDFGGGSLDAICDDCGSTLETTDEETKWDKVREKLPKEYLTGEALETDDPDCPRCGIDMTESSDTKKVTVGDNEYILHKNCAEDIENYSINNNVWFDTFTPEHYEAAADYLRSFDTVGEVITFDGKGYQMGEMYVHTNYATTSIVDDVIETFGGRIVHATITTEGDDNGLSCVNEHGTCFEILIDFCSNEPTRSRPDALDRYGYGDEDITPQDHFIKSGKYKKHFDANFDIIKEKDQEEVPDKCS